MRVLNSLIFIYLLLPNALLAQPWVLSGVVADAESGEKLAGAQVADALSGRRATSDAYGYFSLTLAGDSARIYISLGGYERQVHWLAKGQALPGLIGLRAYFQADSVVIEAGLASPLAANEASAVRISAADVKLLPALGGEPDLIKVLDLMPGVQSGSEGSAGLYVRGGGPDQNLILLDDVPLYYVGHFGNYFSIFNIDAVSGIELTKSGFPARYGGRLSSILDIRTREGNMQQFSGKASLGLLASRVLAEGPIVRGKASYLLSLRRSYLDLFSVPITRLATGGESSLGYRFYDVNVKANASLGPRDHLYLGFYTGSDAVNIRFRSDTETAGERLLTRSQNRIGWGNQAFSLRWNRLWGRRMFSNLTATYTQYRFETTASIQTLQAKTETAFNSLGFLSNIRDLGLRWDFQYYPGYRHALYWGAGALAHQFQPGRTSVRSLLDGQRDTLELGGMPLAGREYFAYAEERWKPGPRLELRAGLHAAAYRISGETFYSAQPRLALALQASRRDALHLSYTHMTQFLHLLSSSDAGLPTDLWVPATPLAKPESSRMLAAGWTREISAGWKWSTEAYYKTFSNLIEYKEGASFFGSELDWQQQIETGGRGWAYGFEALLSKKAGRTRGWIGYTLSWNFRQFDAINGGTAFPYRYDRRHDVGLALMHTFSKRLQASATWTFGTGNAVTAPTGQYAEVRLGDDFTYTNNTTLYVYEGGRNNYRLRNYHRLDLALNWVREKPGGTRTWSFSVYNAYGRRNPYFLVSRVQFGEGGRRTVGLQQFSLFPILPSVSYSFDF